MTKFAKQTTVAPAMIAQAYETGRVPPLLGFDG